MKPLSKKWLESRASKRGGRRADSSGFNRRRPTVPMSPGMARVRDAFRVEPLEPRVLLSADPVFVPLGETRSFAEHDPEEKHAVSHRADAFAKLVAEQFG